MPSAQVVIDGVSLTLTQLMDVARHGVPVQVSEVPDVRARIELGRLHVERIVAQRQPVYGVTTRLGGLATSVLAPADARDLQRNAIWMHKTGAGRPIRSEDVRGGMLLRMNSLVRGASGVRPELIDRIGLFLNRSVTPVVHEFGSIGASGDLVPLSYVAGAIMGSEAGYQVEFEQQLIDARDALKALGLRPLALEPKEGLALINGTSMSTAVAATCSWDASRLLTVTLGFHALALEALRANMEPFEPFVHDLKAHSGQIWIAQRMRALLDGSRLTRTSSAGTPNQLDGLVQDRYSVRCLPQFLGPIIEGVRHAARQIEIEMNAVSDNPLIDSNGACYQGGNFLAQIPALAMDHLRQYVGLAAKHIDAQIALLMTPQFSGGLPASLVGNEHNCANMGLKGLQLTGNSMMPLLTFYGNTFIDRFPTHAEQFNQNINSLSYSSSLLARESIRIYAIYLSIALLVTTQALDLRAYLQSGSYDPRPLLAPGTRRIYEALRLVIGRPASDTRPFVRNDDEQALDGAIAAVSADLAEGQAIYGAFGPQFEP